MTSALVISSHGPHAPTIAEDLHAVGIDVLDLSDCPNLVQIVLKLAPDIVICFEQSPKPAFFEQFLTLRNLAPRPVIVFTSDPDAEMIALATRSFIHAYVVAGYSRTRLRSVIQLAQARFREDHLVRKELSDLKLRFEERTLIDRAKGILMGARSLREEEAYRVLRSAAMGTKQRIGQTAQLVIDSAHYAEAVNRSGQLRMLSQRLVKLYALSCAGVSVAETEGLLADSEAQIESTLATLRRNLSEATFGDLLDSLSGPWGRLKALLGRGRLVDRLEDIDALAEEMLEHSERLTSNLEVTAFANALHAINLAGRQRMLSQRLAKQAMMLVLLPKRSTGLLKAHQQTAAELEHGLTFLRALPLSNAEIAQELAATGLTWERFQTALIERTTQDGRERLATMSEALLGHFERLTDLLERAIQVFIG
jgi:AmiR/NasT family two-component response regulator